MHKRKVTVGGMHVAVGAVCPDEGAVYGLSSWSLRNMQSQEDTSSPLTAGLRDALREMGVHRAYAPHIAVASARIVDTKYLKERIDLGEDIVLHRNNSVPADGVFIGRGHSFVMSAAGCPIIIAVAGEQMIVAHAGRDSLVDRGIPFGKPTRRHLSIVNAIVEAFNERGMSPDKITMCMLFSIPATVFEHNFNHPVYGEFNHELARFVDTWWPGCTTRKNGGMLLNLEYLFEIQAREVGVRNIWIGNSLAEFPGLAHTRDGQDTTRRNLFIVKRNQESA